MIARPRRPHAISHPLSSGPFKETTTHVKTTRIQALFRLLALSAFVANGYAADIPTPESVLGFKVGADRKLADWTQIVDYFRKLDAASERVKIDGEGKTTLGRPFLAVVITSEANMGNLEAIRQANLRLADPRGLSDDDAKKLIATGKTIIAHNHGIHATEVAAPQTSMELAYLLATSQDQRILDILDKAVIVMLPGHNPDGTQMVVDWYKKSLGTAWEGEQVPFLYHHYNGHDNNRDWYMFTQAESQATATLLYDRWKPQIVHDLHQMGSNAARIFAPPYVDPWEPGVDPSLIAATNTIGTYMAARLTAEGKRGVVVNAMYDGFSPARQYPVNHGGVRILTECASAKMATPIDLKFEQLGMGIGYDAKKATWNFPAPWMGGTWRLRDIVDYQISASLALLEHGTRNRDYWLSNFLAVNRRASSRTEPFAYVVSADQKDPVTAAKLLEVMKWNAVEVQRAKAPFTADGKSYPIGSFVISMQQPSSGFAKSVLERQKYPDLRQYPGGPPQRPYDVTAHTLPLLLNVEVSAVSAPFAAELEKAADVAIAKGGLTGQGTHFAFGHHNNDLMAAYRLMKAGLAVSWATEAFTSASRSYPAGTLLIPSATRLKALPIFESLGVKAEGVRAKPLPKTLTLKTPRVGLYQSYVASMDEGWTRFIFDKSLGLDYATLHDRDVRGGNLRAKFDAIILPDATARQMIDGHPRGEMADEFASGLGVEGVAALKAFAESGGTLIAFNNATELLTQMGAPVKNILAGLGSRRGGGSALGPESAQFYCPGAILDAKVDQTHPLAAGLDARSMVWFEFSPAFEVSGGRSVLTYDSDNALLSGWLLGGKMLNGKSALVEVEMGQGKAILFGFRPQYRAQSWATYIPMMNALLLSSATIPAAR